MRSLALILLCTSIYLNLSGQDDKFSQLAQKAYDYMADHVDSCFIYSDSLQSIANEENNELWSEKYKYYKARCHAHSGEVREAESLLLSYLTFAEQSENKQEIANTVYELINVYFKLEDRESELLFINRGLVLYEELDDRRMIAKCTGQRAAYAHHPKL